MLFYEDLKLDTCMLIIYLRLSFFIPKIAADARNNIGTIGLKILLFVLLMKLNTLMKIGF